MTASRKGFSKERHTGLKLAISAFSLAGFAAAWAGFASNHSSSPTAVAEPSPSFTTPPPGQPATATPRVRLSRGS